MAKTSFANAGAKLDADKPAGTPAETPTPETAPEVDSKTVAVAASTALATGEENPEVEGELSTSDLIIPWLNIAQKTGQLSDDFGFGSAVLDKETLVANFADKDQKPLRVVGLKVVKRYQEVLPYGSGVMPRMFGKADEVRAAGLSLEWGAPARAQEVALCLFWMPQPEGVDAPHIFTLEGPEGFGAIVKYFAAKTSYPVGKNLLSASVSFLAPAKGGLKSQWWGFVGSKKVKEGNSWFEATLRPQEKTSPELQKFLSEMPL